MDDEGDSTGSPQEAPRSRGMARTLALAAVISVVYGAWVMTKCSPWHPLRTARRSVGQARTTLGGLRSSIERESQRSMGEVVFSGLMEWAGRR